MWRAAEAASQIPVRDVGASQRDEPEPCERCVSKSQRGIWGLRGKTMCLLPVPWPLYFYGGQRPHAKTPHFRAAPFTLITLRGENEIRTRDTLLEYTRFPGVPLKPLEHLSLDSGAKVILFPESLANFLFARQRKPTAAPLRRRQHPHGQCRRALSPRSGRPRPSCSPVRAA